MNNWSLKNVFVTAAMLMLLQAASSQVSINTNGTPAAPSAMLDISSDSLGVLIPRMDSTSRLGIISPAPSLLVYDSTTTSFWYYDDDQWIEIAAGPVSLADLFKDVPGIDSLCMNQEYSESLVNPYRMILSGDYLYVYYKTGNQMGSAWIKPYDISDAANPVPGEALYLGLAGSDPENGVSLTVVGNTLYALRYWYLHVIDIQDPFAPVEISEIELPNFSENWGIKVVGDIAYVAGFGTSDPAIFTFDISDPGMPFEIGYVTTPYAGVANSLEIRGDYLLFASIRHLYIYDASNPTSITLDTVLVLNNSTITSGAYIGDQYAYFTKFSDGDLIVVDISDPTSPVIVSTTAVGSNPISVTVAGNFAYVGLDGDDRVVVVDITDPADPVVRGGAGEISKPVDLVYANDYLHVADPVSNTLKGFSLTSCDFIVGMDQLHNELAPITYDQIDKQTLSLSGSELSISNGNSVDLDPIDNQGLDLAELTANTLRLSLENDGEPPILVDLTPINTDNQAVDTFGLDGNMLRLSLDNDGAPAVVVDLTPINTDNQVVDTLELDGNNLRLSLQDDGESPVMLDLSPINTDNQGIDTLELEGNILRLSLEGNGEAASELDLSFFATDLDNQSVDTFTIEGNTLSISMMNDGQPASSVSLSGMPVVDTDGDTKIEVEQSPDDDQIRFTMDSIEYFRMLDGRIEVVNTFGNIFVGSTTGQNLNFSAGGSNIGIGASALRQLDTASANIAIGSAAMQNHSMGGANIAIGFRAGEQNIAGEMNVFIGRYAGRFETGSEKLYIENTESSSPLIYGEFDNDWLQINGRLTPTMGITDIDGDTKIQVEETPDEDIIRFDIAGVQTVSIGSDSVDINGVIATNTLEVGGGDRIEKILKTTVTYDLPLITGNGNVKIQLAVPGALVGGSVIVSPSADLGGNIGILWARVSAADEVEIKFYNNNGSDYNPAQRNFYITVMN